MTGLNAPLVKKGKGDMLGEIEMLEDRPRQVTAKVLIAAKVLMCSRKTVYKHPDLLESVRSLHSTIAQTRFWSHLTYVFRTRSQSFATETSRRTTHP